MSIKLMARVFERSDLNSTEKLVLLSIADFSNDSGVSWPSIKSISEKCSLSERCVQKKIQTFVSTGVLLKSKRTRGNGSDTSSMFLMFPEQNWDSLDDVIKEDFVYTGGEPRSGGRVNHVQGGGEPRSPLYEPSLEPSKNSISNDIEQKNDVDVVLEWWNGSFDGESFAKKWGFPKIHKLTASRRIALVARIKDIGSPEEFIEVITNAVNNSKFLQGKSKGGWKGNFDFFIRESSYLKVAEGVYEDKSTTPSYQDFMAQQF